jgi:hypothetical protein
MGERAKHTSGPWHCTPEADLPRVGVYAGPGDDVIICDVTDEDLERDGELEANAYLIAAAPALLAYAECQEAWERFGVRLASESYLRDLLRRHGWKDSQPINDFLQDLRTAALASALGRPAEVDR